MSRRESGEISPATDYVGKRRAPEADASVWTPPARQAETADPEAWVWE